MKKLLATISLVFFTFVCGLAGDETVELKVGDTFKDCETCPAMVVIPSGKGMIGLDLKQKGTYDHGVKMLGWRAYMTLVSYGTREEVEIFRNPLTKGGVSFRGGI